MTEFRFIGGEIELRGQPGAGAVISGYGAVYGSPITIGRRFHEVIAPTAFKKSLREGEVRSYFNHDPSWPLARTANKSLVLSSDEHGLHYESTLPETQQARDLYALIERGDVSGSSFAFETIKQDLAQAEKEGDLPTRTLKEVKLYEVGPVSEPAYEATDVTVQRAVRSLEHSGLWVPDWEEDSRAVDPNVGGGVDKDKIPDEDFAGKNRSFPIVTPKDVHDAAASIGRAGPDNYSSDQLKANIIRIAKRKGPAFVAQLPQSWQPGADASPKRSATTDEPAVEPPEALDATLQPEPVLGTPLYAARWFLSEHSD